MSKISKLIPIITTSVLFLFVALPLGFLNVISPTISISCMNFIQNHLLWYLIIILIPIFILILYFIAIIESKFELDEYNVQTLVEETRNCQDCFIDNSNKLKDSFIEEKQRMNTETLELKHSIELSQEKLKYKKKELKFFFNKTAYISTNVNRKFALFCKNEFPQSTIKETSIKLEKLISQSKIL